MATTDVGLEADTKRIEQLVGQVIDGRVRLPDFQRRLRWRHGDVRMLFDSIFKGFPIGTLLLWKRGAEADPQLRIGPVHVDAPQTESALWVVDGQQRLTSLVAVLRHPEPTDDDRGDMFNLWFDLETREFFHPNRTNSTELAVPLARVLDASGFQGWLFEFIERTNRRDLLGVANRLGTQVRDYRVPLYTVDTDDEEIARDIFVRINRSGRRMEMHEVFAAMAAPGTTPDVRPEYIAERLAERYGPVPPNNVFKAASALRGDSVTHAPRASSEDAAQRASWMAETEESLRAAYDFLSTEVIHTRLLPARVTPVITLARFFHRFPDPSPRNLRLLRRWLWRGFFSGTLESDARTLRRAVTSVEHDEDEAVQALLRGVRTSRMPLGSRVDSRNGQTRLAFLVLAHQNPRFPDSEGDMDQNVFTWLGRHESRAFARWPGSDNVPWARFLTPGVAQHRLRSIIECWCAEPVRYSVALRSHLISPSAAASLLADDIDGFLSDRREHHELAARELHLSHAEPDAQDRPALRAI